MLNQFTLEVMGIQQVFEYKCMLHTWLTWVNSYRRGPDTVYARSIQAVLVASCGSTPFPSVGATGSVIHMAKFYVALDDSNISLSYCQNWTPGPDSLFLCLGLKGLTIMSLKWISQGSCVLKLNSARALSSLSTMIIAGTSRKLHILL